MMRNKESGLSGLSYQLKQPAFQHSGSCENQHCLLQITFCYSQVTTIVSYSIPGHDKLYHSLTYFLVTSPDLYVKPVKALHMFVHHETYYSTWALSQATNI